MSGTDPPSSSLEVAAVSAGMDAVEAFDVLANETRLAILLALWEAAGPIADTEPVSFSELRELVGVADPGQFNYHLRKLDGLFVTRTDDGYVLRPAGLHLVQTVIAGTGTNKTTLPPTDIGGSCLRCDGRTEISFQDGWLFYACTECEGFVGGRADQPAGILFSQVLPPAALSNRTPEAVFEVGVFRLLQGFAMKMAGICPQCSGVLTSRFEICEAHHSPRGTVCAACQRQYDVAVEWDCTVCKYRGLAPPSVAAIVHPLVTDFYHEHGIDVGYTIGGIERCHQLLTRMRDHEQELVSTDPPRVLVTVRYDSDETRLTFDDEMNVVEGNA